MVLKVLKKAFTLKLICSWVRSNIEISFVHKARRQASLAFHNQDGLAINLYLSVVDERIKLFSDAAFQQILEVQ